MKKERIFGRCDICNKLGLVTHYYYHYGRILTGREPAVKDEHGANHPIIETRYNILGHESISICNHCAAKLYLFRIAIPIGWTLSYLFTLLAAFLCPAFGVVVPLPIICFEIAMVVSFILLFLSYPVLISGHPSSFSKSTGESGIPYYRGTGWIIAHLMGTLFLFIGFIYSFPFSPDNIWLLTLLTFILTLTWLFGAIRAYRNRPLLLEKLAWKLNSDKIKGEYGADIIWWNSHDFSLLESLKEKKEKNAGGLSLYQPNIPRLSQSKCTCPLRNCSLNASSFQYNAHIAPSHF